MIISSQYVDGLEQRIRELETERDEYKASAENCWEAKAAKPRR